MSRRVKDFVEVADHLSIDELIQQLIKIRDSLSEGAEPQLKLRGDDIFGHRITISYFRPQTEAETELELRYAESSRLAKERELQRLEQELGVVCHAPKGKRSKLRIVA